MSVRKAAAIAVSLLLTGTSAIARPAALASPPPMCDAVDLSLGTDDEGGYFTGMSHAGTLVVLRNVGPKPCRVDPFAPIALAEGEAILPIRSSVEGSRFMHPGPVVSPVALAPGAELTATLRWVSGDVYSDGLCFSPTELSVTIGRDALHAPLTARLCGSRSAGVSFSKKRFVTDPVYVPAALTPNSTLPRTEPTS